MACIEKKIFQAIDSSCNLPARGIETVAYLFNRKDLTPTPDPTNPVLITDLEIAANKVGYKITGYKDNMNAGHDMVKAADAPNRYTHYFSFHGYEFNSDAVLNIDQLEDLVVVVERKEKFDDADGTFVMYGLQVGLTTSTDTLRMLDANSVRKIELVSTDNATEKQSQYNLVITDLVGGNYAATKALLETLITVTP